MHLTLDDFRSICGSVFNQLFEDMTAPSKADFLSATSSQFHRIDIEPVATALRANEQLNACHRRATQLIWTHATKPDYTEVKQKLEQEFGVKIAANVIQQIDHKLAKST